MSELLNELQKVAATLRYDDSGNPMMSMYSEESVPYINNYDKNRRTLRRIGPGLAAASLGVGLGRLKEKFPNSPAKKIPNKLSTGLMFGGTAATALGGAYNHIKERRRSENISRYQEEKTAGLLSGLMQKNKGIHLNASQRKRMSTYAFNKDALKKAQVEAYQNMLQTGIPKKAFLEPNEWEKTAATKAEKEQIRRMVGMSKRKIKKQKPNKTKESMYRMKKQQKKLATFDDVELEKIASLMADQFIVAASLQNINPEAMTADDELIAGYKAYLDEVNEE